MSKLRLRFAKEGRAVYISHLDLMRTFQRVFIRAGLVLRHSQGFHPHPLMTLALPLPLGQSSVCELLDFETDGAEEAAAMAKRLGPWMPEGLRALDCWAPERPVRELSLLRAEVTFRYDRPVSPGTDEELLRLLGQEELVIRKRTKRKAMAEVDLGPMIRELTAEERGEEVLLHALVQAQNPGLNPALLAAAVETYLPALRPEDVLVRRTAFLDSAGKEFR